MSERTYALKFLRSGAIGPYSTFQWPVPNGKPGKWVRVPGDLVACVRGIHACTFEQAPQWVREECWVIELEGPDRGDHEKLLHRAGRLVRLVDGWNRKAMVLWAADVAEHVLPIFEETYSQDDRPRKAIQAARDGTTAAYAAYADAYAAYDAAAAYAAYDAANAAFAAANAANAAAFAANAADNAANAAYDAAYADNDAAYADNAAAFAADNAANAAYAHIDGYAAERRWQSDRLRHYITAPEVAS